MPEGDTIFRAARTLQKALAGRVVTRFDSALPELQRVDVDTPLKGRSIESVEARGKHLLMTFSGGLVLHTHMRMHGSWHLYRPGEPWRLPAREMRIVIETDGFVAVGFRIPIAELLTAQEVARHDRLRRLGPDLLGDAFDRAEALRRIGLVPDQPIGDVILNQAVVAGIGNVFRSEVLFEAGVNPMTAARDVGAEARNRILDIALRQLRVNVVSQSRSLAPDASRRTTGSLDPRARLWVYGRAGQPCRRCGAAIRTRKSGPDARSIYWCPRCQP